MSSSRNVLLKYVELRETLKVRRMISRFIFQGRMEFGNSKEYQDWHEFTADRIVKYLKSRYLFIEKV